MFSREASLGMLLQAAENLRQVLLELKR